ncbi:ARF GTPase-activating protein GIT2b isoform X1 [Lates japonicus]|uniref:ARF GTPase-activating protein GIT2b isoform X1 n=1 Tax=Lates japonicus TaxID=270547 RepID=A0AAD3ML00_LATJO|nr:ARF GTPase-activating protein GIT2b isoform X1 [Lates japonicus]
MVTCLVDWRTVVCCGSGDGENFIEQKCVIVIHLPGERGFCHIAAKAGQMLQAELLAVYGADPGALDSSGKTSIDYARLAGHQELAERLVEIQYELTDRLTFVVEGQITEMGNTSSFHRWQTAVWICQSLQKLQRRSFSR